MSLPLTASQCLIAAAGRLRIVGWIQGANARDAKGRVCGVHGAAPHAFSIYGAICHVLGPGVGDVDLQASRFWRRLSELATIEMAEQDRTSPGFAIFDVNDRPGMTADRAGTLLLAWSNDRAISEMESIR